MTAAIRGRKIARSRQGTLSVGFAWGFTIAAAALLVIAAWRLNRLAFELSPVALAMLFLYSYTKRFTSWSHFVLGFCLGMSPAAAWIAVRGSLDARMLILCAAVTLWVGGFDVLYACQDVEFDKSAGLHSIPKKFGIARAFLIARAMHIGVIALPHLAGVEFCSRLARLGGNCCCCRVARLRTFAREAHGSLEVERGLFHRKWLYQYVILAFLGCCDVCVAPVKKTHRK